MLTPVDRQLIELALTEDTAFGDITSQNLFEPDHITTAQIITHQPAVMSGLALSAAVFEAIDPSIQTVCTVEPGACVTPNTVVMDIHGPTCSVLMAERVALNFLQLLSGMATLTYQYVGAIAGTNAKLTHTRKTIPGLRHWSIQAVLDGGAQPHRRSLSHAILVKDNHLQAVDGHLTKAVKRLREKMGHMTKLEVECDTMAQVEQALEAHVDVILLDNMTVDQVRQAVTLIHHRALVEVSGGISLKNITAYAETGVDIISTSQITLAAPPVDLGLDLVKSTIMGISTPQSLATTS